MAHFAYSSHLTTTRFNTSKKACRASQCLDCSLKGPIPVNVLDEILPKDRVIGVETGGCPHTAIREDASINLAAVSKLQADFPDLDIIFIESGGDNLSATFSPELADITIYVIFMAKSITGWSTPSTNLEGRRPRSMELRFSQPSSFSAKTKPYPYQRLQYQE